MAVMKRYPVKGSWLARGHWLTDKAPRFGPFAGRTVMQHTWVALEDGRVLDPTRFAFEDKAAYIYLGPMDHYNLAGDAFRRNQPVPEPAGKNFQLHPKVAKLFGSFVGRDLTSGISLNELFWIANRPLSTLGTKAKDIYQALDAMGKQALIPSDSWDMAMDMEKLAAKPRKPEGWYTLPRTPR